MKFNKKTAAFALTAIVAMGSVCVPVMADNGEVTEEIMVVDNTDESSEHANDIIYGCMYFNKDTQMITGYYDDGSSDDVDLVIPSEIDGVPVLGIGEGAFLDCWDINSVVIEEGVQTIGNEAFKRCELMQTIYIPSTVTEIGYKAFYEDGALRNVNFAENSQLATIDEFAFAYCDLGSISIPASVQTIESCAFKSCETMYACIFEGDAPENIDSAAFAGYLEETLTIYFYEGKTGFTMPYWLGFKCNMINEGGYILIADENTGKVTGYKDLEEPEYLNGVLQNPVDLVIPNTINGVTITGIDQEAFMGWERVRSVEFEDGIEYIGFSAFQNCVNIETVSIPDSVTYLDEYAFYDAKKLKNLNFGENPQLAVINYMSFGGCGFEEVVIPASVTNIYEKAFRSCKDLEKVYFEGNAPQNIEEDENAFAACSPKLVLYFYEGSTGFTTPKWAVYKCVMISTGAESYTWNFSDAELSGLGTITSNTALGNMTILANAANPVQVKENARTLDGITYDYCLSLKGKGNPEYRAVKLDVTRDCTISIAAASNDDSRSLTVVKEDGTVLGNISAGKELSVGSVEYTGRVDSLYIYSEKDNVNIYDINIECK